VRGRRVAGDGGDADEIFAEEITVVVVEAGDVDIELRAFKTAVAELIAV